jgi:Mg2+/Co2+ transporter CorB
LDSISSGLLFAALIVLLLLSAFFSGSETALMALNRYRLRHLAQAGNKGAIRAQKLLEKPDRLIGLILLGNNFVNILITQVATLLALRHFGDAGLAIATGILTLVLLIFAEVAPKTLAALHSEKIAFPASFIYVPLMTAAYPVVWVVNLIANTLLRLLGLSAAVEDGQALSQEELRTVVNEASGLIPRKHQKMLLSILDLEKATVEDIMVPRNEIVGIDLEEGLDDIRDQILQSPYTRLPLYHGSIDTVHGFVHIRRLLPLIARGELSHEALMAVVREPYFIPEGTQLNRQLINFQRTRRRIGVVVDEYGDIQGLVTLEDILEEIVGEFTTDPSELSRDILPQEDQTYLVDGGTHIREINRTLGWELPTEGPRTLNGLILEHLEMIPEPGTSVLIEGYPIEIVQTKGNAVKTARLSPRLARYTEDAAKERGGRG